MVSVSVQSSPVSASVAGSSPQAFIQGASVSYSIGQQSGSAVADGGSGTILLFKPPTPAARLKPAGYAWILSTKPNGSISLAARSSTGYSAVLWWDGTLQVFGGGSPTMHYPASKTAATTGPWGASSPRNIFVWSCVSATSAQATGSLLGISATNCGIRTLSVAGCGSLQTLDCSTNSIDTLDLQGCTSLSSLTCYSNSLKDIDTLELKSLTELYCQSNPLSELTLTANEELLVLQCNSCALTSLDLSTCTKLASLFCHSNQIQVLNLSNNKLIKALNCSGNMLVSVRAAGAAISGAAGANLSANQLNASALNALYEDLASVSSGSIYVAGNPGVSADSPSIAVAKGYTVYGS